MRNVTTVFVSWLAASKKVPVAAPCATEPLGQNYGFTLFSSAAPSVGNATVEVNQVRDRAQVFVDGKRLRWARDAAGRLSRVDRMRAIAGLRLIAGDVGAAEVCVPAHGARELRRLGFV